MIILISGLMGVGKTTFAELLKSSLEKKHYSVKIIPFAKKIKEIAVQYFTWNGVKDKPGRVLLQELGSVGRKYNAYIWVNYVIEEIKEYFLQYPENNVVLIDDWRYENELMQIIYKFTTRIVTIRVVSNIRGGQLAPNFVDDSSEHGLDNCSYCFDFIINNSYETINEFEKYISEKVVDKILTIK